MFPDVDACKGSDGDTKARCSRCNGENLTVYPEPATGTFLPLRNRAMNCARDLPGGANA